MIGLDVSLFTTEVARILLLRGTNLPPAMWKCEPNRGAKRILDDVDDATLFAPVGLADESMGAAVRALLYMWTGWLGECQMFGSAAPKAECLYMSALCERHAGRFAQAKAYFKELDLHPVYEPLSAYTMNAVASVTEPSLVRIKEMLQQDARWEPYLFCDAVTQAGLGRLKQSAETLVQQVVCREFELLFVHCYEVATGQKLAQRVRPSATVAQHNAQMRERRIREERRRREEEQKRQEFVAQMAQTGKEAAQATPATLPPNANGVTTAKVEMIGVLCPKCGQVRQVAAALRGKATKCPKCGTAYLVPSELPAAARSA